MRVQHYRGRKVNAYNDCGVVDRPSLSESESDSSILSSRAYRGRGPVTNEAFEAADSDSTSDARAAAYSIDEYVNELERAVKALQAQQPGGPALPKWIVLGLQMWMLVALLGVNTVIAYPFWLLWQWFDPTGALMATVGIVVLLEIGQVIGAKKES